MALIHLIRFPNAAERKRALRVFLEVPATRVVLPGHDLAVTNEHIQALERERIAFEYFSPTNAHGQGTPSV